jgi:hypothetical protein
MKTDPNYPRMLFHRSLPPVTVQSQSEEQALGPEWSRTILAPKSAAPPVHPPEPEKPVEEPPEPEEEEPEEEEEPPLLKEPEPTRRQPVYQAPVKRPAPKTAKKKR